MSVEETIAENNSKKAIYLLDLKNRIAYSFGTENEFSSYFKYDNTFKVTEKGLKQIASVTPDFRIFFYLNVTLLPVEQH